MLASGSKHKSSIRLLRCANGLQNIRPTDRPEKIHSDVSLGSGRLLKTRRPSHVQGTHSFWFTAGGSPMVQKQLGWKDGSQVPRVHPHTFPHGQLDVICLRYSCLGFQLRALPVGLQPGIEYHGAAAAGQTSLGAKWGNGVSGPAFSRCASGSGLLDGGNTSQFSKSLDSRVFMR